MANLTDQWSVCPKPIFYKNATCKARWSKYEQTDPYLAESGGKRFFKTAGTIKAGWVLCESHKRQINVEGTLKHSWIGLTNRDSTTGQIDIFIWDPDADRFWDETRSGESHDGPIGRMLLSQLIRQQQTFCAFFGGYKNKNARSIYYGGFGNDGELECLPNSRAFLVRAGERIKRGLALDSPDFLQREQFHPLSGHKG